MDGNGQGLKRIGAGTRRAGTRRSGPRFTSAGDVPGKAVNFSDGPQAEI